MLNLPRLLMRPTVAQARGIRMAHAGQLPFIYFDAMALSEAEAEKTQFDYNLNQTVEEAKSAARRGPF